MTENIQTLIDRKIKKLQALRDLLADPEMVELVQTMLVGNAPKPATVAASQEMQFEFPRPPRKYRRHGGSLIDQAYKSLRQHGERTTAKDLADFMRSSGYKFKARDANIAVSKALRILADLGRIKAERGEHAKAAIVYWAPQPDPSLDLATEFPAQEETTH
jgi:hypothetical protein